MSCVKCIKCEKDLVVGQKYCYLSVPNKADMGQMKVIENWEYQANANVSDMIIFENKEDAYALLNAMRKRLLQFVIDCSISDETNADNEEQIQEQTDIKKQEQGILDEFETKYRENGEKTFNRDGLVLRGQVKRNEGGWYYEEGNEAKLWNENEGKRIMILTKDLPNESDADIRTWTGRDNDIEEEVIAQDLFFQNLIRWTVGLYAVLQGDDIRYNELSEKEWFERFDKIPLVRINVKKNSGESLCSLNILAEYIERYKDLLQKQIALYDADVIVCCGFVDNHVSCIEKLLSDLFDKLEYQKLGFKQEHEDGGWILKGRKNDKEVIVINMYHPSYPGRPDVIKKVDAYNYLMENFKLAKQNGR